MEQEHRRRDNSDMQEWEWHVPSMLGRESRATDIFRRGENGKLSKARSMGELKRITSIRKELRGQRR